MYINYNDSVKSGIFNECVKIHFHENKDKAKKEKLFVNE